MKLEDYTHSIVNINFYCDFKIKCYNRFRLGKGVLSILGGDSRLFHLQLPCTRSSCRERCARIATAFCRDSFRVGLSQRRPLARCIPK
jgi:hypothetical protein